MVYVLINGVAAGVLGTLAGGAISAFLGKREGLSGLLIAAAAGFMLAIVCFDLVPESVAASGVVSFLLSAAAGVAAVAAADAIVQGLPRFKGVEGRSSTMLKTGILMFISVALHDLPEGIVIGAGGDSERGAVLALLIGLHNIPEGIAVATPLIEGGVGRVKAALAAAATGVPTVIGAIIGFYAQGVSQGFLGVALGFAAGAMSYVVFAEMLPEAYEIVGRRAGLCAFICLITGAVAVYALI